MISQKASGTVRNSLKWKDPLIVFKYNKNFMDIKLNNLGSWYNTVFCWQLIFYFGIFILCLGVNKPVDGVHFLRLLISLYVSVRCLCPLMNKIFLRQPKWGWSRGPFFFQVITFCSGPGAGASLECINKKRSPLPLPFSLRTFIVNLFSSPVV